MSPIFAVLAASVTTFAATNLDDLVLLTVFFARRVPTRRVVAGQYLGFAAIVLMSVVAVWVVGLAVPRTWTRFLGILPLAIGIKNLLHVHKAQCSRASGTNASLSVFSVAAITLSNGADNIGVYAPFFIASRSHLWWVLAVYALLVLVWCIVGKLLGSHALVLKSLDQWGHWVVPFILIALGCFILLFPILT
jgi:cadmium resistance protein CadD (predicted permease)